MARRCVLMAMIGGVLGAIGSASAAPVKVAEAAGTTYLVDTASVVRADKFVRASVIHDYAVPEGGAIRSRRVVYDVDCSGERLRSVSATEHAEPMAHDTPVRSWERESDWLYVGLQTGSSLAPRTPYRAIVRFVCPR